ncbi:acyl-protein synthetase [Rheinheimera sp. SA_1]|uniref:LuxE/PaaK family acyltransferase n=1 Tax=Rheinheimera sp. SA_1 TaxID=1827365 RepID=UPI0007FC96A3|nr:acyl-protein synthetase [Rheinheimera sp. SA_1]OBP15390.1 acyl-protein synthetase [Rheinheimera sp. SA_1]
MQLADELPYALAAVDKTPRMLAELQALTLWHQQQCPAYQQLVTAQWPDFSVNAAGNHNCVDNLAQLPYLAVRLFKQLELRSVPQEAVFKTLYSSGTTGTPSRIFLDRDSAAVQSKILVKIMQHWLGKARLPMLILDHPGVISDRSNFSARGAGIQGLSFMGRNHCYAFNADMSLNWTALEQFVESYGEGPVLLFGFTFMVWQHLLQALMLIGRRIHLPQGILLHSGGWKKLEDQAVSNQQFKQTVAELTGISRVHNFYGMVEQIGAIFVECNAGHLHCPVYADVLVRRPGSWEVADIGESGVLQLLSTLPRSYPGHSLLTEDRAQLLGEDNCSCGLPGKYFRILGRLPQTEARGCSDTFVPALQRKDLSGAQAETQTGAAL